MNPPDEILYVCVRSSWISSTIEKVIISLLQLHLHTACCSHCLRRLLLLLRLVVIRTPQHPPMRQLEEKQFEYPHPPDIITRLLGLGSSISVVHLPQILSFISLYASKPSLLISILLLSSSPRGIPPIVIITRVIW